MKPASDLIVSVSGIRGIVGRGLVPEIATRFAAALATFVEGGPIVVSRDGRPSGAVLRHAVLAGLLGAGCKVFDLGIVPTPTCGFAIRKLGASGGVQITASHNPAEWNGLKLFSRGGMVLTAAEGRGLVELFEEGQFGGAAWDHSGTLVEERQANAWHRDRVLELVDAERIRQRKPRVFVDANGGAGGPAARSLLEALGCGHVCHACDADGVFRHEPEPIEANLKEICAQVPRHGADVGFVLDPDADRLAIIDEQGRYIGEELTLALAAKFRLRQQPGPVVLNMSTSRVTEDIAHSLGVACHRSAVGEANVGERMREVNAVIGGEGNGGVIDPRVGFVRDPFIGMGLILNLLAETGRTISQLVAELPSYSIVKEKYEVERDALPALFQALERRWPEAAGNLLDGLRLDWPDRWIHVRPSNTEPIVRVIAEAPTEADARKLCRDVAELLPPQPRARA